MLYGDTITIGIMTRRLSLLLFSFTCLCLAKAQSFQTDTVSLSEAVSISDSLLVSDSLSSSIPLARTPELKPRPWLALGDVVAINGITHLLGRYALKASFSQTTMKSIRNNFKSGFAWDDDNFYINYPCHAMHGAYYYNSGRSNGLNLLQSIPYTLIGSLSWEFLGENEQPSINDVITTTVSGTLFGEVIHLMAQEIVDESERGGKRFLQEAVAALVNPVEGFHRLISGRAWRVRKTMVEKKSIPETEEDEGCCVFSAGGRYIAANSDFGHGTYQPLLSFAMQYGQIVDDQTHPRPYDSFSLEGTFAYGDRQHILTDLHLTARICGIPAVTGKNFSGEWGLYQHFHYDDTRLHGKTTKSPFPFGEMASFGPGFRFAFPQVAPHVSFKQEVFARGIILGAVNSDYYEFYNRTYNMGSGFGVTTQSRVSWHHLASVHLKIHYMRLFTWKGYEPRDLSELVFDTNYLNVLGDRSSASLLSVNLRTEAFLSQSLRLMIGATLCNRHSHYKYHADQRAESCELRAALAWHF